MDFSYENQGANTYLVYEIKEGDSIDTLSLGMLTNNSIPGLTRALFTQMDEKRYIKYNVSSKVSMQQFFGGVVNRKRLLGVFNGITEGFLSAEDYMIDTSSIVLDPEYIFADVTTCAAALICLPIANAEGTGCLLQKCRGQCADGPHGGLGPCGEDPELPEQLVGILSAGLQKAAG